VHAISAREGIMARVLIVFGTTNGQTAKIASRMGGTLRNRGHEVTVASAAHR